MVLLLLEDVEQGAAKRGGKLGPAKERPREELDRHELVMREAREARGARGSLSKAPRGGEPRRAARQAKARLARWLLDAHRVAGLAVVERRSPGTPRGAQLAREVPALQDRKAVVPDALAARVS